MPWSTDDLKRLIEVEARLQGVDPQLALALATQESYLNPHAKGDNGRSLGLFQLQEAAAKDAGIDPARRGEVPLNVEGGIRYLKLKLDQSGGNVSQALSRYNRGTPDYRGIGDPHYEQNVMRFYERGETRQEPDRPARQGVLQRVVHAINPGSAEAATPQAPGRSRLDEIEAELARREAQTATEAPRSHQEPRATPDDGAYAAETMARLRGSQAGAMGLQPPPAERSALAVGGGPSQQAPPVTDPAALLAGGRRPPAVPVPPQAQGPAPAPSTYPAAVQAIEPLTPRGAEAVHRRVHEQGIPLSAVPAIAVNTLGTVGGAALGALTSPVTGPIGPAAGAAIGGSLATRANTALGLAGQEKPLLETPVMNVYPSDLLGAIPLGVAGVTSAAKATVRNLPGANVGRHEIAAEKLGELGQRLRPATPSSQLFTEAAAQGGAVPTPQLWRAAGNVVREEKGMHKGFVSTEAMQAGNGLLDLMRKHGGNVPLEELEKYRQRLGQKIGTTTDRAELKRLEDLYGALHADLGQAAITGTAAGAGTLKAAIATKRKEHAHETLTDIWSPGQGLQLQEGAHVQVYGKRIRNAVEKRLHQDKLFADSFTPADVVDMRNTLREVGKLTRVTNPDAQGTVGSTLTWLGRLGGAGYGATTGDLFTGGAMILATEGTSAVLTQAMQSKVGRWALREAIREGNGTLTHGSLSAIAALVAREAAPEPPASAPTP